MEKLRSTSLGRAGSIETILLKFGGSSVYSGGQDLIMIRSLADTCDNRASSTLQSFTSQWDLFIAVIICFNRVGVMLMHETGTGETNEFKRFAWDELDYERERDREWSYRDGDKYRDRERERSYRDDYRDRDRDRDIGSSSAARSPPPCPCTPPTTRINAPPSALPPATPTSTSRSPAPQLKSVSAEERQAFIRAEAKRRLEARMQASDVSAPATFPDTSATLSPTSLDIMSVEDRLIQEKREAEEKVCEGQRGRHGTARHQSGWFLSVSIPANTTTPNRPSTVYIPCQEIGKCTHTLLASPACTY